MDEPGPAPEPRIDPEPDPGNEAGGTDAVEEETTFPPVTPETPLSAQIDDSDMPDEVSELEPSDTDANQEDPTAEPPG